MLILTWRDYRIISSLSFISLSLSFILFNSLFDTGSISIPESASLSIRGWNSDSFFLFEKHEKKYDCSSFFLPLSFFSICFSSICLFSVEPNNYSMQERWSSITNNCLLNMILCTLLIGLLPYNFFSISNNLSLYESTTCATGNWFPYSPLSVLNFHNSLSSSSWWLLHVFHMTSGLNITWMPVTNEMAMLK